MGDFMNFCRKISLVSVLAICSNLSLGSVSSFSSSLFTEEEDLEIRAMRSQEIAGAYIQAYGIIVDGDDNTTADTISLDGSKLPIGLIPANTSLLKSAIEHKIIPISVSVIATRGRSNEILWRTERNDRDPNFHFQALYNLDALKQRAKMRAAAFLQQGESDDYYQEQEIPLVSPFPSGTGTYEMAFDPDTGETGWISRAEEEDRRQDRRDQGWDSSED